MATKSRGRPLKGEEKGKTAVFSTRIDPELRERLVAAQKEADTPSLTAEIEHRLRASFELDDERDALFDNLGGPGDYAIYCLFAELVKSLTIATEAQAVENGKLIRRPRVWREDRELFDQVAAGMQQILSELRPTGESPPLTGPGHNPATIKHIGQMHGAGIVGQFRAGSADEYNVDRPRPRSSGKPSTYFSGLLKRLPVIKRHFEQGKKGSKR